MSTTTSDQTNEFSFILAPSLIAGVGVFATHRIKKETKLNLFSDEDPRYISDDNPLLELPVVKKLCETYCVRDSNGYHCARNFGQMEVGWYLIPTRIKKTIYFML